MIPVCAPDLYLSFWISDPHWQSSPTKKPPHRCSDTKLCCQAEHRIHNESYLIAPKPNENQVYISGRWSALAPSLSLPVTVTSIMSSIEPYSSRRFPLAVDLYSANPAYSVSQNEFESTIQDAIRHPDHDPFANDHKYYLLVEPLLRVQANTKGQGFS
jgi:hypothetical protein